nr:hypothetical protein Iba_chr02bCG22980 [Ipomoea batatas]GMC63745.1 hypothetical protein Iba_chr02cCG16170 [Ipomoea batatas]GMD24051.1 hypothetical protein Iba_scaffold42413CG0040 [Ipomoea batatas]GME21070.1 hypothetical protein Iba_scaffold26695CG0010 [Ipomoea batatas]
MSGGGGEGLGWHNINIRHNQRKLYGELSISVHSNSTAAGSASDDIKAHFSRVSGLQLYLDAIELSLEPIFGACIDHLASHPSCISYKIKVVDSIATLICRKAGSEVLIALCWLTKLFYNHLLLLLFNLENYEAETSFCLQF